MRDREQKHDPGAFPPSHAGFSDVTPSALGSGALVSPSVKGSSAVNLPPSLGFWGAGGELPRNQRRKHCWGQLIITWSADQPWLPALWLPGASQSTLHARLPRPQEPRGGSPNEDRAGPELAQQGCPWKVATADG